MLSPAICVITVYTFVCVHARLHACTHVGVSECVGACVHVCVHVQVCKGVGAYMHE